MNLPNETYYFALWDTQTKCYLSSGKNSLSIEELMEDYVSYKSIDTDLSDLTLPELIDYCEIDGFIIDKSHTKFW